VSPVALKFDLVPEVRCSSHRAIGFLHGDPELNAHDTFTALNEPERRYLLSSMGEWIDGQNRPATRFHGFPNHPDCSMCFVFKAREKRQGHRFYAYLCHPLRNSNPRFQLCVLCIHALKNQWETDQAELARVKAWYADDAAKVAIRAQYPDEGKNEQKGRQKQWKN